MAFEPELAESLLHRGFSRRQLGRIASLLTAGATFPFYNEFAMAQEAQQRRGGARRAVDPDAVRINQNENPMGPCKEGLEAIMKVAPHGWRYSPGNEQGELVNAIAETEDIKPECISVFAGSSDPLNRVMCAFTSPTQSWTMANPGYGGGAPAFIGSKLTRVPLRADYAHDGEAMIKADPTAGAYYVCNPNNQTGSVTPR
ncbi:MAG: aminotransferase, partial [Acidobacteriia bacterium]|nr:aminotransferase [Terriglobia bacterium]